MNIKVIVGLLLWLAPYTAASQQDSAKLKVSFEGYKALNLPVFSSLSTCMYGDKIFYISDNLDDASIINKEKQLVSLKVFSYDTRTAAIDSIIYLLPYTDNLVKWKISSLAVNKNYTVFKVDKVYIFNNGMPQLFADTINIKSTYLSLASDEVLFVGANYNWHVNDNPVKTKLSCYNLKNKKISSSIQPGFEYIFYTHLPGNFFDTKNGKILFSQTIPYKIELFSDNLVPNTSIVDTSDLYNPYSNSLDNLMGKVNSNPDLNPKTMIDELQAIDKKILRIEKVYFLDDKHILVSKRFSGAGMSNRLFDVWEYNKRKKLWVEIVKNQLIATDKLKSDEVVTNDNMPLYLPYVKNVFTQGNKIFLLTQFVPPSPGMKHSDFKKNLDNYYAKNQPTYFIFTYNWQVQ